MFSHIITVQAFARSIYIWTIKRSGFIPRHLPVHPGIPQLKRTSLSLQRDWCWLRFSDAILHFTHPSDNKQHSGQQLLEQPGVKGKLHMHYFIASSTFELGDGNQHLDRKVRLWGLGGLPQCHILPRPSGIRKSQQEPVTRMADLVLYLFLLKSSSWVHRPYFNSHFGTHWKLLNYTCSDEMIMERKQVIWHNYKAM